MGRTGESAGVDANGQLEAEEGKEPQVSDCKYLGSVEEPIIRQATNSTSRRNAGSAMGSAISGVGRALTENGVAARCELTNERDICSTTCILLGRDCTRSCHVCDGVALHLGIRIRFVAICADEVVGD